VPALLAATTMATRMVSHVRCRRRLAATYSTGS
jgi:hypothetical protein